MPEPQQPSPGASEVRPPHRRPRGTLYRYLAREALVPSAFALLGLTAVVLTKDLVGFFPALVNRGVGADVVGRIALYKAVPVMAWMSPFAVLVGSLVALGRLGADREILVLEASGVAAPRLLGPVVAFGAAMTLGALALSLLAGPWALAAEDAALRQIVRERPWAQIRAGAVNRFGDWQLEAREVSPSGEELTGVLLWMPEIGETIFARGGAVVTDGNGTRRIVLREGAVLPSARGAAKQLRFDELSSRFPAGDEPLREETNPLQQLPLTQLIGRVRSEPASEREPFSRAAVELHRRIATPLATLVFALLAVPLFLWRAHFSRASGGMLGILLTLAYYGLLQLGEGLVQGGALPVAAGAWLPHALLLLLAATLLWRVSHAGALGLAFDRPQRSRRQLRREARASSARPHRFALPRYVARRFFELAVMGFAVIFVAYLLIDVMERLDWFQRYRASGLEVARFYGARVWLLISRAFPMALLVGMALTVSLLAVEGELIGMRACGIPALRAVAPALALATLAAPFYFALNNAVVPRTNALADYLKRTEIKDMGASELFGGRQKAGVWYRSGDQVVEASLLDLERGVARDLTVYDLGENGLPVARTDAPSANHIGGGDWKLDASARVEVQADRITRVEPPKYAALGEALPAEIDTMHLSVLDLGRQIAEVEGDGYDATELRVDFHAKLAEPLACVVLPAVVLLFAVGGPPFPGPAQTLLVSAVLAVTYILSTGLAASLGYGKAVPAALAAWAPMLAYAALAGVFGWRLWRRL